MPKLSCAGKAALSTVFVYIITLLSSCTVYQKTNDLEKALADATKALEILNGPKGTRTLLARANLQKG